MPAKCNMVSWMGFWNRNGTLGKKTNKIQIKCGFS